MDKKFVSETNSTDATGDKEMLRVQEQRRVVIPESFLKTHDITVGDKVIVLCEEDGVKVMSADDAI